MHTCARAHVHTCAHAHIHAYMQLLRPLRALRPSSTVLKLYSGDEAVTNPPTLTFEHFVSILEETQRALRSARSPRDARLQPNEHWATQSELCGLHALRYDFVGLHNDLARESKALESMLGFDARPPAGADYGWEGNQNSNRLLARYYTSRSLINRVALLYKADVKMPLNGVQFHAKEIFGRLPPL